MKSRNLDAENKGYGKSLDNFDVVVPKVDEADKPRESDSSSSGQGHWCNRRPSCSFHSKAPENHDGTYSHFNA